jgi:hypothetical protein
MSILQNLPDLFIDGQERAQDWRNQLRLHPPRFIPLPAISSHEQSRNPSQCA